MSEWTDKPAEYWHKRSMMDENYLDAIITIIGMALPHIQPDIEVMDEAWNRSLDVLNAEYPLDEG